MEEIIHGYHFDRSEGHNSPNGTWYKAESGGKSYFLKKFQQPKFPKDGINPELYNSKKSECDEWLEQKRMLIAALNELGDGTGNIISPRDVFREKLCFYQATYWIDVQADSLDHIKNYSDADKIMILKTYSAALKRVHSKGIIHGDLKPDNVLIGKSASGKPSAKLIDFDDSYFSKQALSPDLTIVTDAYQSPELAAYKRGHVEYREKLTCASDVFASGIIFHQFWCGEMPEYEGKTDGKFLYEAIAAGGTYTLHPSIPAWLKTLITAMLHPDPENRPTMEIVHKQVSFPDQKIVTVTKTEPPTRTAPKGSPMPAESTDPLNNTVKDNAVMTNADFSIIDSIIDEAPDSLSDYAPDKARKLIELFNNSAKLRHSGAGQEDINSYALRMREALNDLLSAAETKAVDKKNVEKMLAAVPKDLSKYTDETAEKLAKAVKFAAENKNFMNQEEIDKLAKLLYVCIKGLVLKPAPEYSIVPCSPLPIGYSDVKILSEDKVCVYTLTGSKITLPRTTALSMKFVKLK